MNASPQKLTADEAAGLEAAHNLADAHTHQTPSSEETDLVFSRVEELMDEARRRRGKTLDREAFAAFMRASGQGSVVGDWFIPTYASSVSMEIAANVLSSRAYSVALVEPTFDCIADILKRNGLSICPIHLDDNTGYQDAVLRFLDANHELNAIFLVCPNNPTGHVISESQFAEIVQKCHQQRITILLDTSFRVFDEDFMFDQYNILKNSGVNFILIEDTGKIWPTLDIKISYILSSPSLREELEEVANDILLNVSPFASALVREYSTMSAANNFRTVRALVEDNRITLRRELGSFLPSIDFPYPSSRVSVEIIRLPRGVDTSFVAATLLTRSVAVLSGAAFFWNGTRSEPFIRVALARDRDRFRAGIERLKVELADILEALQ